MMLIADNVPYSSFLAGRCCCLSLAGLFLARSSIIMAASRLFKADSVSGCARAGRLESQ